MGFRENADAMRAALGLTPGWDAVRGDIDDPTLAAILEEAAKTAQTVVAPLNGVADGTGARFEDGRVRVPPAYGPAYAALAEGGWLGLEQDPDLGGQGLPLSVFVAVNHLFERASPAFMMAAGGSRAAARLLTEWADADTRTDWVPQLIDGRATATICISEPEAGSDVGRIRTRAERGPDGWAVTGQKIWISFGGHDMGPRIGHCLLARTNDRPGTRGLSLFFVPEGPGVAISRIEEKLGLHGSPTCAIGFERAPGVLVGEEGRGLPQLFTMIRHMRLMVACQGLGVALACLDVARAHAEERRQGGDPAEPPVAIANHPDVRRQLRQMQSDVDLFRLALAQTAVAADLGAGNADMARLSAWLLPLVKNFGAELGFDTAARATLVLGGSGYTRDYPVEQALRDARVFAIYEGTTGMQAQDFLLRQCLAADGAAVQAFLGLARAETAAAPAARVVIEAFATFFEHDVLSASSTGRLAMAEPAMRAAWVAVQAWMAARIPSSETAVGFLATAEQAFALHAARARFEASIDR